MTSPVTNYIGVMKDSLVEVEGVDYANQLTRARAVPDVPVQTQRVLIPNGTLNDVDSAAWTFEVAMVQKLAAGGFAQVLNDATPGDLLDVVFEPVRDVPGQPHYEFQIRAMPVPVGGDQGAFAVSEVTFTIEGTPTKTYIPSA